MTFKEFCEKIKEEADGYKENLSSEIITVSKNNDVVLTGLVLRSEEVNISPTIYLDGYYEEYKNGRPFQNIMHDIYRVYEHYMPDENFDINFVTDFEKVKGLIQPRLVNYELNKDRLETMPYKKEEDLAVIYCIDLQRRFPNEIATISVTNQLLSNWNTSRDELHNLAMDNMSKSAYLVSNINDVIEEMTGDEFPEFDDVKMHVLTNSNKTYGAVEILNPAVQDEIAGIYGNKYSVIPSSVHEVIVVPYSDAEKDAEYLEAMIREVNETQLLEEEVLSNHAYLVDAKEHLFMRMDKAVEAEKKKQLAKKADEQIQEQEKKLRGPKL